jgi:hypothetical protein
MSEWTEDQDPYEVLGLTQGHESTEAQIKKVWFLVRACLGTSLQAKALTILGCFDRRTGYWL